MIVFLGTADLILNKFLLASLYMYFLKNALRGFAPDIGTNVKFLGSVFLISTLKKSQEIIKEIWGHWACFGVTTF
jgi:hypothetical protein